MSEELRLAQDARVPLNINLIDRAVDFFATYADLCHHGIEELYRLSK